MAARDAVVGVSAALEALRQELEHTLLSSQSERLRFGVPQVRLTMNVVARTDTTGGGKLRWFMVEGSAERSKGREASQTLELTVTPQLFDGSGKPVGPLDDSGR
jgi:hypothetical protein